MKSKIIKTELLNFLPFILLATLLSVCFFMTAPKTITWWSGSSWSLAAATLGISSPPGSLLLAMLGWLTSSALDLLFGINKAFGLNLFAGLISLGMLFILSLAAQFTWLQFFSRENYSARMMLAYAAVISGSLLSLGLSFTVWQYSIKFTPYILSGLVTAGILYSLLRWWQEVETGEALGWVFIICLLFGIDFSVHRTNLLLVPGLFLWVLLKAPKTFTQPKKILVAFLGITLGLSIHLLLMPLAALNPPLNMGDPSSWSSFYDYVSLKQYGGNWLVNLWPRKGEFWGHQIADYLQAFSASFANLSGPLGVLGILPLLSGLFGLTVIWRRDRKLALGVLGLFALTSFGAVVYFNLPTNYPWPMNRHYIPSFVLFGFLMTIGAAATLKLAYSYTKLNTRLNRKLALAIVIALAALAPVAQLSANYRALDSSEDSFAYDYALNTLNTLAPNAILLVEGEHIWPLLYLKLVEGFREDVSIMSPSLMNTSWYVQQLSAQSPKLPIELSDAELNSIQMKYWPEDTVITVLAPSMKLDDRVSHQESITDYISFNVPANIAEIALLAQDWLLLDMIVANKWQRPIYFTRAPKWLQVHCRNEGLVSQLLPTDSAHTDCQLLWQNLMEKYSFTGYHKSLKARDKISQAMLKQYRSEFESLLVCLRESGASEKLEAVKSKSAENFLSATK